MVWVPVDRGTGGTEVLEFARAIGKREMDAGRFRSGVWSMELTQGCFAVRIFRDTYIYVYIGVWVFRLDGCAKGRGVEEKRKVFTAFFMKDTRVRELNRVN